MSSPDTRSSARLQTFLTDRDNRIINIAAGVSALVAVVFKVVFGRASATPWLDDLANLLSELGLAYVASWIFYYLVAWRPRRQDRDRALLSVGGYVAQVHGCAEAILLFVRRGAGTTSFLNPISQRELAELTIPEKFTDSLLPQIPGLATDSYSLSAQVVDNIEYSEERIDRCMRLATLLDAKLLGALEDLSGCRLFFLVRTRATTGQFRGNARVFSLVPELYEYLLLADRLVDVLHDYRDVLPVTERRLTAGPIEWEALRECPWPDLIKRSNEAPD